MRRLHGAVVSAIIILFDWKANHDMGRQASTLVLSAGDMPSDKLPCVDDRKALLSLVNKLEQKRRVVPFFALRNFDFSQPDKIKAGSSGYPLLIIGLGVLFGIDRTEQLDG